MPVTRIDLQFPVHLFSQLRLGKHALNGFFHNPGRTRLAHPLNAGFYQTAGIPGEVTVDLGFFFFCPSAGLCWH